MHDPKFEKDVQQKMEELSFLPSESVWVNVEKEIRKEKKRRVPVLWLLLAGLMLAAGGYYTIFGKSSSPAGTIAGANNVAKPGISKPNVQPAVTSSTTTSPATASSATTLPVPTLPGGTLPGHTLADPALSPAGSPAHASSVRTPRTSKAAGSSAMSLDALVLTSGSSTSSGGRRDIVKARTLHKGAGAEASGEMSGIAETAPSKISLSNVSFPGIVSDRTTLPAIKVNVSAANKAADKKVTADSKARNKMNIPHRWKIGLTGGAGFSAIDKSLFKRSSVGELSTLANTFAAYPPGWQTRPSTIRPGGSFAAGVLASRSLSRKVSFSIGLNYHYYSTSIQTGLPIKQYANMNPSALGLALSYSANNTVQTNSLQAYSTGEESVHKGQYHLLELPVSVQWQFAHLRKLPLCWEAGIAVSELVGADALHFDGLSGTYYKDNAVFKKTQVSASTSVMIGLPAAGHGLLVGPEIQYGLTDLLKTNIGDAQHLLFGGIKMIFMLKK